MHIVRLMNNLVKRSKKNDDKSAVAMLKKNVLHDNVWQLVVNLDKSHERSGTIDQGNLIRRVIRSWDEDHLNVDHRTHDNWVVSFKT